MAKEGKSSQGYVKITENTLQELNELLDRQNKMLQNRSFISVLPDKGERVRKFKEKITDEIAKRGTVDTASALMAKMNLKGLSDEMEWLDRKTPDSRMDRDSDDDSDEEIDPLKLIATHSGTQKSYQKKVESAQASLVTSKDLDEIKTFSNSSALYAQQLCKKYDSRGDAPERFKPNEPKNKQLSKTGYKSSSEHVQRTLGKNWEVTAATPPVPVHASTEMLSLADSLALQQGQAQKLKAIQTEDALARLRASGVKFNSSLPFQNTTKYRQPVDPTGLFEGTLGQEHEPACDDESEETGSAVFYNIVDDVQEHS